ncbi:MAG: preprotein translocase subunit YajC [Omnitrophica bacterium RIFCSPHIGHO2_02_FULL_46_11]|nr:MAG: preprotein translocase subunit YajC [Omnitrophica bacterium RIFCSPHIGHO2_02_FULL_46_11]OGW87594.1 MAG: preprotein translocase subunit YajC [Omnitrophica bacterium RIFCSPLOWO2_01_FULL_45_10b]
MPSAQANPILSFLPLILMFVVFYFLLIRPQQKRQKEHANMVKNLKKGDRIATSGGIIGTIHTLQDDYVVLKVGDQDTKIEVLRSAVQELRKS